MPGEGFFDGELGAVVRRYGQAPRALIDDGIGIVAHHRGRAEMNETLRAARFTCMCERSRSFDALLERGRTVEGEVEYGCAWHDETRERDRISPIAFCRGDLRLPAKMRGVAREATQRLLAHAGQMRE